MDDTPKNWKKERREETLFILISYFAYQILFTLCFYFVLLESIKISIVLLS